MGSDAEEERPRPIPITDALDLHTIVPRDIPDVVTEYLWEALEAGFAEVRVLPRAEPHQVQNPPTRTGGRGSAHR